MRKGRSKDRPFFIVKKAMDRISIYLFRDSGFSPAGDTVVAAAPAKAVVDVYGGGGLQRTAGLSLAFGGCAIYGESLRGNDCHFAVWGQRKAAKFRQSFRNAGMDVEIIKSRPPGRLLFHQSK